MAVIHKSRRDPRRAMRAARRLMILCWPLALLTAALTVLFYIDCRAALWTLACRWRDSFAAWALGPGQELSFAQEWHETLWTAAETALRGVSWAIFGGTLALPALLGLGLTVLFAALFRPARKRYRTLRARVNGMAAALKLLRQLPKSCHLFTHRRIVFDGGSAEPDVILAGPGGVAVLEVRNASGLIEGCVTDQVLRRRLPSGEVEKLRNPARQAVSHVMRLSNYLSSAGLSVGVIPCVLFVHPEASVYVVPPEQVIIEERRTRVSSCIMTDATSFWEALGRDFAGGRQLSQGMVEQIITAIRKAPEK